MKRLGVLMPSRNSYSEVSETRPSSTSEALAGVPPWSKAMLGEPQPAAGAAAEGEATIRGSRRADMEDDPERSEGGSPPTRRSCAAPATPADGPDCTQNTGWSAAARAPTTPPLDAMTR